MRSLDPTRTRFHRDGHVTVWDVYRQEWSRTPRPRDEVLASLPPRERERVIRHCGIGRATAADRAAAE